MHYGRCSPGRGGSRYTLYIIEDGKEIGGKGRKLKGSLNKEPSASGAEWTEEENIILDIEEDKDARKTVMKMIEMVLEVD